jgi:MSHA biogenesis protein MshQ
LVQAESVLIKACTNESCSELSTESVTLDFLADGAVISSPSFVGSTPVPFNHRLAETLTFSLTNATIAATNPLVCDDSNGTSCDMIFSDAGFRFLYGDGVDETTSIGNQTSGKVFADIIKLQAVENVNGVCTGLFSGDVDVELSQQNIAPIGTTGLNFKVNGTSGKTIDKYPTYTPLITLTFDADSKATIPMPVYLDAGQIRLYAKYTGVDDNVGVSLVGESNDFWVSPEKLVVTATASGNSINGNSDSSTIKHKAGQPFDFTVTAYNALGTSAANITANYIPNDIQLLLTRTGPTAGGVNGTFNYGNGIISSNLTPNYQSVTLSAFDAGVYSTNSASYSEVGLLTLDLRDVDYGFSGNIITTDSLNIGRFIPDYFEQTVVEQGALFAGCYSTIYFAYTGQRMVSDATKGAISYLVNPVVELTAKNVQGATVQNYTELGYNKFIAAANFIIVPATDSTILGKDTNLLPLTANLFAGTLSIYGLSYNATSFGLPLGAGILHYELADRDNFFYPRNENSEVIAQYTDIDFYIDTDNFKDSDGIGIKSPNHIISTTGINLRFGRAFLDNSFGPETANFPQKLSTQYLNASGRYMINEEDSCTPYDASNITLTSSTLNKNLIDVNTVTGQLEGGKTRAITLTAPGAGNQGSIKVEYTIYDWLKYDWDWNGVNAKEYNQNPTATATFGLFRGNDRIIYQREVFY